MIRRIFTVLSAVSLVLCLATAALWVRSYWTGDVVVLAHFVRQSAPQDQVLSPCDSYRALTLRFGRGQVDCAWELYQVERSAGMPLIDHEVGPPMDLQARQPTIWNRLGFQWAERPGDDREFVIPLWPPVILSAIMPAVWLLRRKRGKSDYCAICGYDLRATPEDQSRYPLKYAC